MRTPTALLAAFLAATTVTALATPAGAAPSGPVGGDRLGSRGLVVAPGVPAPPAMSAASWVIADLDSGEVLAAKDPHGRYAPASTLKVLTAAALIPRLEKTRLIMPTWEDVNVEGSKVGIVQKMNYTAKDLFTSMLVVSGNDAANALATANGGLAPTLAAMNAEARRVQARDTLAMNANGLDHPRQLSSAYDLALIGRAAMQLPDFRDYVATKRYTMPAPRRSTFAIASHNKLLWNYDGAIGIKNGYTTKARATFVGAATRGGRTLIISLMKSNPRYWPEAAGLLNWGFAVAAKGVTPVGTLVAPVAVEPQRKPPAAATTYIQPAKAAVAPTQTEGLPVIPGLVVAAGVATLGGGLLKGRRARRRRNRYGRRLTLNLPL